jgi:anti-sigma-K factor RskA
MTGSDPGTRRPDCGNDAAPYVLGALEPSEARAFANHIESCAACRDEVAALVPVLNVLPACVSRCEVSAALRRRVMHAVNSEPKAGIAPARRLRRWMSTGALALGRLTMPRPAVAATLVLALALGVVIGLGVVTAAGPGGSPARIVQASVGRAEVRVAGDHGELIVDHLPPAAPDRVYELWLARGHGAPAPSTLFAVTSRGTAVLGVPGDLTGISGVLVTVEPAGGSPAPTTRAVIVAQV